MSLLKWWCCMNGPLRPSVYLEVQSCKTTCKIMLRSNIHRCAAVCVSGSALHGRHVISGCGDFLQGEGQQTQRWGYRPHTHTHTHTLCVAVRNNINIRLPFIFILRERSSKNTPTQPICITVSCGIWGTMSDEIAARTGSTDVCVCVCVLDLDIQHQQEIFKC